MNSENTSDNTQSQALNKTDVSGSTYYISQNIVKTKKVKLILPLYACVEGENERTYCKITDDFISILKTNIFVNEISFNRIKRNKDYPIAEIWYNNRIDEKEFQETLSYARRNLSLV